jgi:hypothetical protein
MTQANKSHEHQFGKSDLLKSMPINIAGTKNLKNREYILFINIFLNSFD